MKRLLLLILISFHSIAYSQKAYEDVIYLKNGNILKGRITSINENQNVSIELYNRNKINLQQSEIDSIKNQKVKHLDIFHEEIEKSSKKTQMLANLNYIVGYHDKFKKTKTITNQLLLDVGFRYKKKILVSVGTGIIQYLNLAPNEYKLINGKDDYYASPDKSNRASTSILYHLPVFTNFALKINKIKKSGGIYLSCKSGYFFYSPEKFNTLVVINRRNNAEVYNLSFSSEYNKRLFVHPELTLHIPTFENKSHLKIGAGYFMDFLTMNYNYTERTFINTNYMLPYSGYWETKTYTEKVKAHLGFITLNVGLSF